MADEFDPDRLYAGDTVLCSPFGWRGVIVEEQHPLYVVDIANSPFLARRIYSADILSPIEDPLVRFARWAVRHHSDK